VYLALDRRSAFAAGLRADVMRSSAIPAMAKQWERCALTSADAALASPNDRKRAAVEPPKRSRAPLAAVPCLAGTASTGRIIASSGECWLARDTLKKRTPFCYNILDEA
jgi:hypothetical protein